MSVFLIVLLKVFLFFIVSIEGRDDRKIVVALSEQRPFVMFDQNGTPTGLDVLIIKNFARKFNFQVDYSILNSSLNYIFTDKVYGIQNNSR